MGVEYWRSKLTKHCNRAYGKILQELTMQNECVECEGITLDDILNIFDAISYDHPELFYLPNVSEANSETSLFKRKATLIIRNIYNQGEIIRFRQEIEKVKYELLSKVNSQMKDVDKEKLVCDFILKNVIYELNNKYNQNAAKVIVDHKGQCSGIAKAVKLMLEWLGIETIVVSGVGVDNTKGTSEAHSWNIVKIDGKYYHLDVTFMLGYNSSKKTPYRYSFFNYSDEQIKKDHSWDTSLTPKCNDDFPYNEFIVNSEHIDEINSLYELRKILYKAFCNNQKNVRFCLNITATETKLLSYIKSCIHDSISITGKSIKYYIEIDNKIVNINWEDNV